MTRHKPHKPTLRSLYQWHRYLGLLVVLIIPMLTISGVLLNHTEDLHLDEHELHQRWLLDWYGIAPAEGQFFSIGEQWLSQWDKQLYLNSDALPQSIGRVVAAVRLPEMIVAATSSELLLFTLQGELIETQTSLDGVPANIQALALGENGQVILRTSEGPMEGDPESGNWHPASNEPVWIRETTPPEDLLQRLIALNPGPGLSAERLLLDLHSGRLFGRWGPYLIDLAAVVLLFNAISGLFIWWRRRRQQRQRALANTHKKKVPRISI